MNRLIWRMLMILLALNTRIYGAGASREILRDAMGGMRCN